MTAKKAIQSAVRPYAEVEGVRVNPGLAETLILATSLVPDPENARLHNGRNLDAVESSLKRFGFQLPILYDPATMRVVAGNGRLKVATERLGWAKVPAMPFTGTPEEFAAYAIMDNRTAELAEWDWQALSKNLRPLLDGDLFTGIEMGFEPYEIGPLMQADWSPPETSGTGGSETSSGEPSGSATAKVLAFSPEQWMCLSVAIEKARDGNSAPLSEADAMVLIAGVYVRGDDR
jgi:hypothetical protein